MVVGFAPTWLRQVSPPPLLHMTTLTTGTAPARSIFKTEPLEQVELINELRICTDPHWGLLCPSWAYALHVATR